jgi:hypothetical protein
MPGNNYEEAKVALRRSHTEDIYVLARFKTDPSLRYLVKIWDGIDGAVFDKAHKTDWIELLPTAEDVRISKGALVLREYANSRLEAKVQIRTEPRVLERIHIGLYSNNGAPYKEGSVSLNADDFIRLSEFLNDAMSVPMMSEKPFHFDHRGLSTLITNTRVRTRYRSENEELLALITRESLRDVGKLIALVKDLGIAREVIEGIADAALTQTDITSMGRRKKALDLFGRLLNDPEEFGRVQKEWAKQGKEAVWQKFFEDNTWILGYGLRYQFGSALEGQRLQQMIKGYDIQGGGKQVDALLKTRGIISSVCVVEIKHHDTNLLQKRQVDNSDVEYRTDVFLPSTDLVGAVAQAQAYAQATIDNLENCFRPRREGVLTGEKIFTFMPRALVVCGSLSQMTVGDEVVDMKFRTFELFRRNINNPEIITFDELYERARFIVGES